MDVLRAIGLQILLRVMKLLPILRQILVIVVNRLLIIRDARLIGRFILGINLHVMLGGPQILSAAGDVLAVAANICTILMDLVTIAARRIQTG